MNHFIGSCENTLLNETFMEMMRSGTDYIFIKDTALVYQGGSEAFAQMANLSSSSELDGKTDFDLFPAEIAEKYRADDQRVLDTGKPIANLLERLPDLNGKPRWTKTWKHPIHDADGAIIGLYGVSRDVSDEVVLEERIKTTEDYIRLLEQIPCGVAILHADGGRFLLDQANSGFMDVHHHARTSAEGLVGTDVLPLVHNDDRHKIMEAFSRIRGRAASVGSAEYRVLGSDGKLHWVGVRFRFAYEKGNIPYYYAAYSGLDSRKRTEEKLEESRSKLEESMLNTDIQFFTYYPGRSRCENFTLNSRFSQLPTVWEHYPDDFLAYAKSPAEDAAAYREMVRAIDRGEDQAECTVRFVYTGSLIWEKVQLKAVRGSCGRTTHAQGHSIDVTKKYQAEERLREERVRLKTLDGCVFESFSFDLTRPSRMEIQTRDDAMLQTAVSTEILEEAIQVCPALAATNPDSREILLKAAARIPDAGDRKLFIATCSSSALKWPSRTAISARRSVTEDMWVTISAGC